MNYPIEPIPEEYGTRGEFIWERVRTIWIKGKSTETLDKIEIMLDGSISTLESKKNAGMAIFGLMMFIYTVRRENEDMQKGIISRPEKKKWWMK